MVIAAAFEPAGAAANTPADLRSSASWQRRLGIESCVDAMYWEQRLGHGSEQFDELFAIRRSNAGRLYQLLEDQVQRLGDARWHTILHFMREWASRDGDHLKNVQTVWFEFDDVGLGFRRDQVPSISACLLPHYREETTFVHADRAAELAVARSVLTTFDAWTPGVERSLVACFSALPPTGRFIHISYMIGREPRAVKLYGMLHRRDLLPYLRGIEFAGDLAAIEEALDSTYPERLLGDETFIDLNLTNFRARERATLGLAVGQQHVARGPDRSPSREGLLDVWVREGLSTAEKAAAARAWVGTDLSDDVQPFLDVKLVWAASTGFTAKAYLGARRCWRVW